METVYEKRLWRENRREAPGEWKEAELFYISLLLVNFDEYFQKEFLPFLVERVVFLNAFKRICEM